VSIHTNTHAYKCGSRICIYSIQEKINCRNKKKEEEENREKEREQMKQRHDTKFHGRWQGEKWVNI